MTKGQWFKLLSRQDMERLLMEVVRRHPEVSPVVDEFLQRHALEQMEGTGGEEDWGTEAGDAVDLTNQVMKAYESQVNYIVATWQEEAVSMDLQRHWDESVYFPLLEVLEDLEETLETVEGLRARGYAWEAALCLTYFIGVAVEAQEEAAGENWYGAHDDLSLEVLIDRALDRLDSIMEGELHADQLRRVLGKLQQLTGTYPHRKNIEQLISVYEAFMDQTAGRSLRERLEEAQQNLSPGAQKTHPGPDWRGDLKAQLDVEVKRLRFEEAFTWIERFGDDLDMWMYLIDRLKRARQWRPMIEAVERIQVLSPESYQARLEDDLCRALRGLGQEDEALEIRWAAFRRGPEPRLFQEILGLSPDPGQARDQMVGLLEQNRQDYVGWLTRIYAEEGRLDALAQLVKEHGEQLSGHRLKDLSRLLAATEHWDLAVENWIQLAWQAVGWKDRRGYAYAARLLVEAREAAGQHGRERMVEKVVERLISTHPRHRALHDELRKAGLMT